MYLITNQQVANTKNTISLTKYNKFQINSSISKKTKQAIKTYDKQKTKKNLKFLKIYQSNTFYLQNYKIFFQQLSLNTNIINIYIQTTLNNMFITISTKNTILTKSLAAIGFKGKSKQTSYAYKTFAEFLVTELQNFAEQTKSQIIVNIFAKSINNKLKVEFNEIYDENIETGKIIEQSIKENELVKENTLITLTISKGQIIMDEFKSISEFRDWANKYNVKYNETYDYSNNISRGEAISYSYNKGDIIDPDGVIYVKISLGKAVYIPSFVGKSKTDAQNTCKSLGIRCNFVTGTYTNYNSNVIYNQSRSVNSKVASGSSITLTLSKGIPETKKLAILQNWLSIGNADATINSLRSNFAKNYPGVNFIFEKRKDNTLNSGMIAQNSPTTAGSEVKQGQTYTIYIVSN